MNTATICRFASVGASDAALAAPTVVIGTSVRPVCFPACSTCRPCRNKIRSPMGLIIAGNLFA